MKIYIDSNGNAWTDSYPEGSAIVRTYDEEVWNRIIELKKFLADSDYQSLKHSDGALSDEEYEPVRLQRQAWRDEINSLQSDFEI